ncbi:MAG: ribosome-binding factor A [Deltaproteobacteria bacterium]|nr:ribosome-binding factor A [Deltaproteobacteria bacterium]
MSARKVKVEQALRDVLAEMIARDVKDPRVAAAGLISVTRVECNVDLSVAHVYVSVFAGGAQRPRRPKPGAPAEAPDENEIATRALAGLVGAAGFLRGPAARKINLARPPELRFHLDPSVVVGMDLRAIILEDEAKAAAAGRKPGDPPPEAPKATAADDDAADDDAADDDAADASDDDASDETDTRELPARRDPDDEPTRDLGAASEEPTVELRPFARPGDAGPGEGES